MSNKYNNEENLELSTLTKKNWVGIFNSDNAANDKSFEPEINKLTKNSDSQEYVSNNVETTPHTHYLHSFEDVAQGLQNKVDEKLNTVVSTNEMQVFSEQVLQSIEKLKSEINSFYSYYHSIEKRNKSLENKLDTLLAQNAAIIQQQTKSELSCDNFFFSSEEKENTVLEANFDNDNYLIIDEESRNVNRHKKSLLEPVVKDPDFADSPNIRETITIAQDNSDLINTNTFKNFSIEDILEKDNSFPEPENQSRILKKPIRNPFISWVNKVSGLN